MGCGAIKVAFGKRFVSFVEHGSSLKTKKILQKTGILARSGFNSLNIR
jgi:hypothetical protein